MVTTRLKSFLSPLLLLGLIVSQSATAAAYFKPKGSLPKQVKEVKKAALDLTELRSQFASWGVDPQNKKSSINLSKAWKNYRHKKEIVVAIVDTGIDPSHPFLKDNIHVTKGKSGLSNFGLDFSKGNKNILKPYDTHGHGTHVAGIVKSVFPKVRILALKYYNPNASGQDNVRSTIAAFRYAVESNVDIINYSGGGIDPSPEELRILREAEKKGILVIAAAGNEESNIDSKRKSYYPASYGLKNVLSVTAYNKNLKKLSSSNYGRKSVDIFAPGYRIKSALPKNRAGYLTGTSQATAFVSGAAALLMSQFPELSPIQIKKLILQTAKKEVEFSDQCLTGGRLDTYKAQLMAAKMVKKKIQASGLAIKTKRYRNPSNKNKGKIIYRVNSLK